MLKIPLEDAFVYFPNATFTSIASFISIYQQTLFSFPRKAGPSVKQMTARAYLDSTVNPVLLLGLAELSRIRYV